jgi:ATP-dependent Clp protease protease subunit
MSRYLLALLALHSVSSVRVSHQLARRQVSRGALASQPIVMGQAGAATESYDAGRMGPPPDMPSLMLNNRIIYLGMPINSAVSQLIVAELLYLQYESDIKPVFMYINSPGLITEGRQLVGLDTEGFAIADTMGYIRAPISTVCVGKAYGFGALMLASGTKGKRTVMPYASVMLQQSVSQAQVRRARSANVRMQRRQADGGTESGVAADRGRAPPVHPAHLA